MRIAAVTGLTMALVSWGGAASGQGISTSATREAQASCDGRARSTYLLGPDDEIEIAGPELDDVPVKTLRIDGEGDVQMPLAGRVHVAGLTVQQAQQEINTRLSAYIRAPQ